MELRRDPRPQECWAMINPELSGGLSLDALTGRMNARELQMQASFGALV